MKTINLAMAHSSVDLKDNKPVKLAAHAVVYAFLKVAAQEKNGAKPHEEEGTQACRCSQGQSERP